MNHSKEKSSKCSLNEKKTLCEPEREWLLKYRGRAGTEKLEMENKKQLVLCFLYTQSLSFW